MKRLLLVAFTTLSINAIAQNNSYPTTGDVTIYNYSPSLILQRNTTVGGFTEGIQTRLQDGTDNWFFGALLTGQWIVSKGNHSNPKMTILDNGNVGIGATNPMTKLEVFNSAQGGHLTLSTNDNPNADLSRIDLDYKIANTNQIIGRISSAYLNSANGGSGALRLYTSNNGVLGEKMKIDNNGNVGIGTTTINNVQGWNRVVDEYAQGHAKLLVRTDNVITGIFSHDTWNGYAVGRIGTESPHDLRLMAGYGHEVMSLTILGNVGIGTTNPDEKLTVNGVIHAKEVKVDLNGVLADFVFKPDYKLMSLPQVEQFVKANNHLPQMPSANEVAKNGLSMGEMQNKLLQKVEELTLYAIQQNKKIESLEKQIKELKQQ